MRALHAVTRFVGIVMLALGVVAMDAVALGHGSHSGSAAAPVVHAQAATDGHGAVPAGQYPSASQRAAPATQPSLATQALLGGSCSEPCAPDDQALFQVCLMVLTLVGFLLLARRQIRHLPDLRSRATSSWGPIRWRPVLRPSLSVLWISRT